MSFKTSPTGSFMLMIVPNERNDEHTTTTQHHIGDTDMNDIDPTPTYGITSYFQGRPNTAFLEKFATPVDRKAA